VVWYEGPLRTKGSGSTEAKDVYGKRVRLTLNGLAYVKEFVAFDDMDATRPVSHNLWNPATKLFEVAVDGLRERHS
jgi:hypothetical protein